MAHASEAAKAYLDVAVQMCLPSNYMKNFKLVQGAQSMNDLVATTL
ncbi:hypothetical protein SNOG_02823 [Parastagonospora nodorum SN15]|uniref:Uncharacterized protein n=1 Tax=Phaeosphaeria nodorum (strain SN15 / ATCC MYA-4574 / FGSC 10173) TaxID=321614 RepID=Q0UZJ1_PHANO|nr:hypothetical protein SNOG_02823 [Parastagonospora nodorum SN15]EAT89554.1 hypothetical protein SNOG_02823 [Parastagonospora nodorum SN15]